MKGNLQRMDWRFWTRKHHSQADTCASLEPLLSLYSDGMASPEEARRVESHLSACVDCQRALRWMDATRQVISKRPAVEPPANLRLRIAQAIAEVEQSKARPRPAVRPLILRPASLALAVVTGFGLVGWFITEHSLTPPSPVVFPVAVKPLLPPSLLTPPKAVRSAKVPLKTTPKTAQVAINKVSVSHHAGDLSLKETHKAMVHPDLMANASGGGDTVSPSETTPIVRPIPAVVVKKALAPGPRLAVLKPTTPVRPKIKPSIDKTLLEAVKPATTLPLPVEAAPPTATREAKNTPSSENVLAPTLAPSTVEIGAPVVVHPMHLDGLIARAHLTSFQDEHRGIKVALDAGARAAASAGTQFVMLPTVYSPTTLSKPPASESH